MTSSTRFADFRWLAAVETRRAIQRGYVLEPDDAMQAALIGLHQADQVASADLTPRQFKVFALLRVRGEIIDELRRCTQGARPSATTNAARPAQPEPGSVAMAQEMGLLPKTAWYGPEDEGGAVPISRLPTPEEQAIAAEEERERERALKRDLPARLYAIVQQRLAGTSSLELSRRMGVSEVRVSQLLSKAIALLRRRQRIRKFRKT